MDEKLLLNNYIPAPFWAMNPLTWQTYVSQLSADGRRVLDYYPIRWAYIHPDSAASALDYLRAIGMHSDEITEDAIEGQFSKMPSFESLVENKSVDWQEPLGDEIPPPGFRMIAEWEPMSGTLINWPTFYPPIWETFRQMVHAASNALVYLRMPEGYLGAAVLAWLAANDIDLAQVHPLPGPMGDIWAKDYSPVYGVNRYTGQAVAHKLAFASFHPQYRKDFKHIRDIDNMFAWIEGYEVHRTEIMYDGGYLMTDGRGTCIATRRVLTDNMGISNLYAKLEAWFGAERLVIIDEEPGDYLGHINHIKFISPEVVLVGVPDDHTSPVYRYMAELRDQLESLGYKTIRLPCPTEQTRSLPLWGPPAQLYANSLIVNDRILITKYGNELVEMDQEALEIYQKALPDHEVIPIDCSILGNGGGGVYCTTHSVPDVNKLNLNI